MGRGLWGSGMVQVNWELRMHCTLHTCAQMLSF
jgi:hypothetical protein